MLTGTVNYAVACAASLSLAATIAFAPAAAAPREALVIAVAKYQSVPSLANPVNDARLVAAALRATGFAVAEVIDPDRAALVKAIGDFRSRTAASEAAIVYFAGHGVEIGGNNYLLPRDAQSGSEELIKETAVRSSLLGTGVNTATRMRLLVLDACRDNPFANTAGDSATRSIAGSRGLAREVVKGVVTLLATSAGQKAADRSKVSPNNSPFARALAEGLQVPGLDIVRLPKRVSNIMRDKENIEQTPDLFGIWEDEDFRMLAGNGVTATPIPFVPRPVSAQPVPVAITFRASPPEIFSAFGIVVMRNAESGSGIYIKSVQPGTPAIGKVFPGDIITRINGEEVDPSQSPAQAIATAMGDKSVARLQIQRGPTTTSIVLRK